MNGHRLRAALSIALGGLLSVTAIMPDTAQAGTANSSDASARPLTIRTVPALSNVTLRVNGRTVVTGADGTATTTISAAERDQLARNRDALLHVDTTQVPQSAGRRAVFSRWYDGGYHFDATDQSGQVEIAAFDEQVLTSFNFTDSQGRPADPTKLGTMELRNTIGDVIDLDRTTPTWLRATVTKKTGVEVHQSPVEYRVHAVQYQGVNSVRQGQQRFTPSTPSTVTIALDEFTDRRPLTIKTAPPLAGVVVRVDGQALVTGADGTASTVISTEQRDALAVNWNDHLRMVTTTVRQGADRRAAFHGWYSGGYHFTDTDRSGQTMIAAFDPEIRTTFGFVNKAGKPVDAAKVSNLVLKNNLGATITIPKPTPTWLRIGNSRSQQGQVTLKAVEHRVDNADIAGAKAVIRGEQHFTPKPGTPIVVRLEAFTVPLRVLDGFFGSRVGRAIDVEMLDGTTRHLVLHDGVTVLENAPAGQYNIKIFASALGGEQVLPISSNHPVDLEVLTMLDLALLFLGGGIFVLAIVVIGIRLRRKRRARDAATRANASDDDDPVSSTDTEGTAVEHQGEDEVALDTETIDLTLAGEER